MDKSKAKKSRKDQNTEVLEGTTIGKAKKRTNENKKNI
ncbi:hypothetical protein HAHI6034_07035 [Hathewaya histolytica]|uniref:Uncharacterized protein n=1 Tax=Hathewaya histolytica TaxID=1498 RepID=A0A4U9RX26_HATHI|nr:Uncharacterised protein [Hathewaya histolytica]